MKKVFVILLIMLLVVGSSGCSGEKGQEITVMLDWYPNAVHSFLYVAVEEGFFAEQGLQVKIEMPAETNDPLKLVAAGQTDFAISYQPQLVMARANDIPVVSIASIVNQPLSTIMTFAQGPILDLKDLEGKTVGYSLPVYEAIAKTALKNAGADVDSIDFIDIGWDLIPALATDRVNATSGGFINHETILLEKEGHPVRTFDPVEYGVPNYYELIMVTNEEMLKEDKDVVEKFWQALEKAQNYVKENPQESLELLLANQNEVFPLDEEVERESLEILLPLMEQFGQQELATWQEVIDWMAAMELIEKKPEALEAFQNL